MHASMLNLSCAWHTTQYAYVCGQNAWAGLAVISCQLIQLICLFELYIKLHKLHTKHYTYIMCACYMCANLSGLHVTICRYNLIIVVSSCLELVYVYVHR